MPDCAHATEAVSRRQSRKLAIRFILFVPIYIYITSEATKYCVRRSKTLQRYTFFHKSFAVF